MGFDEMRDTMLHNEFGSGGAHAATDGAAASETQASSATHPPTVSPSGAVTPTGARAIVAPAPIHRAFRAHGKHAAVEVPAAEVEGPRGLMRYRNATLVGAGGLTCAAVGAFFGGLGGYVTVDPAAAHPVATSGGQGQQLAAAVGQTYRDASRGDVSADDAASFSSLSGGLAQGIDPLQWLTSSGSDNLAVFGTPGTVTTRPGLGAVGSGGSGGSGLGGGLGCTSQSDLGVGCILSSITGAVGDLGASGDPSAIAEELLPSLNGMVTDLTGTLLDLGTLLPISSVSAAGLPASVLDELGLGSITGTVAGAGPAPTSIPSLPLPSSGGSGSSSGLPSHPGLPSLPVSVPPGSVRSSSTVGSSTTTTSTSTTTTTPPSSGGSSGTTVTVPLPALPVPSTPPVSVGGVSVGVNSSSSGSGLGLSLP